MESGILGFGKRNTAKGIRNPLMIVIIHSAHYLFSDWPKAYTGTDHDTLKHCQTLDPILRDTLDDLIKYDGYPNNE